MKTRIFPVVCLAMILAIPAFSQKAPDQKTKAEYVIALITDNEIASVRISAENCHRAYSIDWLARISIKNGFLSKNECFMQLRQGKIESMGGIYFSTQLIIRH